MAIDIKKMEEKFKHFFETENEETFTKWLEEKMKSEIKSPQDEIRIICEKAALVSQSMTELINNLSKGVFKWYEEKLNSEQKDKRSVANPMPNEHSDDKQK